MLTIGQKVRLDVKKKKGYIARGWFFVQKMIRDRLYLKKENSGYIETVELWDLRKGLYRLVTEEKKVVPFRPLEDIKEIQKNKTDTAIKEYRQTIGAAQQRYQAKVRATRKAKKAPIPEPVVPDAGLNISEVKIVEGRKIMKMTKKEVVEMTAAGKTVEEIVEHFVQGDDSLRGIYAAKATLYVNGPKEKTETEEQKKIKKSQQNKVIATLKTRLMEDTENLLIFELENDALIIKLDGDSPIWVSWDKLDVFIANLQKIKEIHEAV